MTVVLERKSSQLSSPWEEALNLVPREAWIGLSVKGLAGLDQGKIVKKGKLDFSDALSLSTQASRNVGEP